MFYRCSVVWIFLETRSPRSGRTKRSATSASPVARLLGFAVETVPAVHGRGLMGWLLGPVCGFYLVHPDEPSIYLIGDAIMTDSVLEAIERLQPDLIVAPAGSANFGIGGDVLFSVDELVALVKASTGKVIFNHLEALDHCPTTRKDLASRMEAEGLQERIYIPEDGESLAFSREGTEPHTPPMQRPIRKPSFQKWLTGRLFDKARAAVTEVAQIG
jgi:hypothetical protein